MIVSWTNQSPLSNVVNRAQQALSFRAVHPSMSCRLLTLVAPVRWFIQHYFKRERLPNRKEISREQVDKDSHSLTTSLLLFSPLAVGGPPGFPQRAKTNNSAKQGSIRPGSSVTLVSHLPGRGLTSQAASRALSWTSSA